MKLFARALGIVTALNLFGCTESAPPAPRPVKKVSPNAGYLQTTIETRSAVSERMLEIEARRALQMFHARTGRYPGDLSELGGGLKSLPPGRSYDYDPATGTLNVR
jgi:hypothetical protein